MSQNPIYKRLSFLSVPVRLGMVFVLLMTALGMGPVQAAQAGSYTIDANNANWTGSSSVVAVPAAEPNFALPGELHAWIAPGNRQPASPNAPAQAVIVLDKSVGTDEPLVGGQISYDINVENQGTVYDDDRVFNLTISDTLPAGLSFASASRSPNVVTTNPDNSTTLQWINIKNLEAAESFQLTINANILPNITVGTPFTNIVETEVYTAPDYSGTQIIKTASVSATAQAIDIEKTAIQSTGVSQATGAGGYITATGRIPGPDWRYTYQLTVRNNNIDNTTNVVVTDTLPPGAAYLGNASIIPNPTGATPTPTLNLLSSGPKDGYLELTWNLGALTTNEYTNPPIISFDVAIPYRFRMGTDPISGTGPYSGAIIPDDTTITNTYEATGLYKGTDRTCDGTESTPHDDPPNEINAAYLTVEKGVTPGTVRHGDTVTYTINYYVSEYYTFTNVTLTDVLTDGLTYGGKVSGPGPDPTVSTNTPITGATTLTFTIPPANTTPGNWGTVVFTATVDTHYERFNVTPIPPIVSGDSLGNRVTVSGHYTDTITIGRPPGTSDDADSASVNTIFPELTKLVKDPDTGLFTHGPVTATIGDSFTFSLTFTVPKHIAVRNIVVDDFLPRGMSYVTNTAWYIVHPNTSYFTHSVAITPVHPLPACTSVPTPTNPSTKTLSGLEDLEWNLCSISATQDVVWQASVEAIVEDVPQVADGIIVANFGNASGLNTFGQSYSLRDSNFVNYVEPKLMLIKSASPNSDLDPGDTVTYTISLVNQGHSPAYNVGLTDTIPSYIKMPATGGSGSPQAATYTVWSGNPVGGNGGVLTWTEIISIPVGGTQTYTYTGVISDGVGAYAALRNIASVEYNSRSDDQGRQTDWTSNPADDNTDDETVRIRNLSVSKSAAPSPVTIGDIYTQFLTITVPAGTRVYASGLHVVVRDVQDRDGTQFLTPTVTLTDISGNPPGPASFASPSTTLVTASAGSYVDFNLNEIDNSGQADYVFLITIQVLVTGLDDSGDWVFFVPTGNDDTSDQFRVLFYDGVSNRTSLWSPWVDIDIVQPLLDLEKTVEPTLADAGDTVTYTLVVTNVGWSIAYDVVMTDAIPVNIKVQAPPGGSGSPFPVTYTVFSGSPQTGEGGVITWTVVPSIAVGATQTYTYTATVSGTVPAGSAWTNTADVDWSTQEGDTDDERVFDDSTEEETRDGGYKEDTDSATLNIDVPQMNKTIFDTSLNATGSGQHNPITEDLAIGEIITFQIVITLPEGTTPTILTDTMPYTPTGNGVLGVLSSRVIAFGSHVSGSDLNVGDSGVHKDLYPTPAGNGIDDTVEFNFGTLLNTADGVVNSSDCITVEVVARVKDVPENVDGDFLTSPATLDYGTGTLSDAVDVEIVEPNLTIDKDSDPPHTYYVDEGARITYTLTITNDGTAPAYDFVISDTLPPPDLTTYIASAITSTTPPTIAFDYEPPVGATDIITWQVNELWTGGTAVITVVVQITDTIIAGTRLTNTAAITYYDSLPDDDSPYEREYSDGSDTVWHWTGPNALDLDKEAEPSPVIAGTMLTYTITLTNVGGGSLTGVFITDAIPLDTTFITATLPHAGPVPDNEAGSVITWPLGLIHMDEKRVVTLTVRVHSSVISGTIVTDTAWAACDQPFTDIATATTPVNTLADLAVFKSDDPDPVAEGKTLIYTLDYVNNGPSYAHDVYITDTLPFSVTYGGMVAMTPTLNGPMEAAGPPYQLTWYTPTLPDGASGTIVFTITVLITTIDPFSNTAVITSTWPDPDPNPSNNIDVEWTSKPPPVGGVILPNPLRAAFLRVILAALVGLLLAGAVIVRRKRMR